MFGINLWMYLLRGLGTEEILDFGKILGSFVLLVLKLTLTCLLVMTCGKLKLLVWWDLIIVGM